MLKMPTENYPSNIKINFGWEGSSSWNGGCVSEGSDIDKIKLIFTNVQTIIEVQIPHDITFHHVRTLPFECIDAQESAGVKPSRKRDSLLVTIEQIKSLIIKANIYTKSTSELPTLDHNGNIIFKRKVIGIDKEVKCETPNQFDENHIYTLVITSKNQTLSASLVKNISRDQEEICKFLEDVLLLRIPLNSITDSDEIRSLIPVFIRSVIPVESDH